jgi:2'-5' RNA ligase
MTTAGPVSGVVVRVRLPAAIDRIRGRDDMAATAGAPPHVTLLFPFMPVSGLKPGVRRELAEIAAMVEPFEVRFARAGRFPGAVYLAPEPSAPFAVLTAAIAARFPDYPPYEGAFDEVIPHLTLVESPTAPLDEFARSVERYLPFTRHVAAMEVLIEDVDARWQSLWRIHLGLARVGRARSRDGLLG